MEANNIYKKAINSISHNRAIKGYLKPNLAVRFEKYINDHDVNVSTAINRAVRLLVDVREDERKDEDIN